MNIEVLLAQIRTKKIIRWITINLIIAIAYILTIHLSHEFTNLPGRVASIWLPAGIVLPAVMLFGKRIMAGLICGSIIGLIPFVIALNPPLSILNQIIFILITTATDLVQLFVIIFFLKKSGKSQDIFANLRSVWIYILTSIAVPFIPSLIGATTLLIMEVITVADYSLAIISWWSSLTFSYLLFSPSLIIWREKDVMQKKATVGEFITILLLLATTCFLVFKQAYDLEYLLLLFLFWSVFRLPRFYSSFLVSTIAIIALISTYKGYNALTNRGMIVQTLFYLKSFLITFSLTNLSLSAVLSERKSTKLELKETLNSLEDTVAERTKELKRTQRKLEYRNQALRKLVNTDGLTQIANRRCFDQQLSIEWNRLYRNHKYLSLLLIDVDYFKLYNDTYGHQLGDQCLIKIAQALRASCLRPSDVVSRYGGEEFALLLPETDLQGAIAVTTRIQQKIHDLQIVHETSSIAFIVMVSIGVGSLIPIITESPNILVDRADKNLYLAKKQGRNCYQASASDYEFQEG